MKQRTAASTEQMTGVKTKKGEAKRKYVLFHLFLFLIITNSLFLAE
ncbi:hypothetical protein IGJ84_002297 [Enterococcus sp. DIV0181]